MAFKPITSEMLTLKGYNGDASRRTTRSPRATGRFPGVVVIHHGPGWDAWTRRGRAEAGACTATRRSALTSTPLRPGRPGRGRGPPARRRRRAGRLRCRPTAGGHRLPALLPTANGKVGIIGFCFGGRQSYLGACQLQNIDAAVDCWGGSVIADDPASLTPARPVAPIDVPRTSRCRCWASSATTMPTRTRTRSTAPRPS